MASAVKTNFRFVVIRSVNGDATDAKFLMNLRYYPHSPIKLLNPRKLHGKRKLVMAATFAGLVRIPPSPMM